MTRKSFFGWVGFSLVTAITLVGFAKPEAAYAARSKKNGPPKTMTISGPVDITGYDLLDTNSRRDETQGLLHYDLDNAVFKLDPTRSRGGNAVYTLVSGTISGYEDSWQQIDNYDEDGNYIDTERYDWTGSLAPQPLAAGAVEVVVSRRGGSAEMVLHLPGVSGIFEGPSGSTQYTGAGSVVRPLGTLTLKKRGATGSLDLFEQVPDPDPLAGRGLTGSANGTLTVH